MTHTHEGEDAEAQFRRLYAETGPEVLRFVRRRCSPDRADDVVAEVFLVVWRRWPELPARRADRRAWIFGVARNCLANDRRGARRQEGLAVRIATARPDGPPGHDLALRVDLTRAWEQLRPDQQEVIALAVWDGLSSTEAARVLGIRPTAYRARLLRSRRALRDLLTPPAAAPRPTRPALERT